MGTRDGRSTLGGKRTAEELKMSHDGLRGGRQVQEKKIHKGKDHTFQMDSKEVL